MIHSRVSKCCHIDTQRIPQISDIKETNPKDIHLSKLLQGYNYQGLKPLKRKNRESDVFDGAVVEEVAAKVSSTSPSLNMMQQPDGTNNTNPIEKPEFTLPISLKEKEFKDALTKQEGFTITSQAFDAARRSFHVKLDIDSAGSVSIWLVERGKLLKEKLNTNLPFQFSSCYIELEMCDAGIKNRKSMFFYSFAHGSSQIVGHRDFVKLEQL
jgi:hypothetical protein